ncbi:MAG: response regulator transcription factor [Proteobacteria bacterium]|nr:response regulator transcription factor [Pseudomonadota bacterium]
MNTRAMKTKVLLVDDDVELAGMLQIYLEREGFEVKTVHDGGLGIAEALHGHHDIAVLDVMMPGKTGIDVLVQIRAHGAMPVLMLTAKGDDADRIVGLELGADDYVPKPCSPRELTARIRAILRRSAAVESSSSSSPIIIDALSIWSEQRRAEWAGKPLELTSTEFNLLEVLTRNAGRVVSKAELSEQALGRPLARFDRSIDVHISSIRRKLEPLPDGRTRILAVINKGYQFIRE